MAYSEISKEFSDTKQRILDIIKSEWLEQNTTYRFGQYFFHALTLPLYDRFEDISENLCISLSARSDKLVLESLITYSKKTFHEISDHKKLCLQNKQRLFVYLKKVLCLCPDETFLNIVNLACLKSTCQPVKSVLYGISDKQLASGFEAIVQDKK